MVPGTPRHRGPCRHFAFRHHLSSHVEGTSYISVTLCFVLTVLQSIGSRLLIATWPVWHSVSLIYYIILWYYRYYRSITLVTYIHHVASKSSLLAHAWVGRFCIPQAFSCHCRKASVHIYAGSRWCVHEFASNERMLEQWLQYLYRLRCKITTCRQNCHSTCISDRCLSPPSNSLQYNLRIVNTTANPDGDTEKPAMLIDDGSGAGPRFPGPLIRATWGDTLVINVKNELQHNGTGIHWHGLRQLNSCQHDGVPGVTECPIAPGKTRQYVFKCTQFGTSWYHSHWSAQYGEGVVGTIIIVCNH